MTGPARFTISEVAVDWQEPMNCLLKICFVGFVDTLLIKCYFTEKNEERIVIG